MMKHFWYQIRTLVLKDANLFFSNPFQFPFVHAASFWNGVRVKQMVSTPSIYRSLTQLKQPMCSVIWHMTTEAGHWWLLVQPIRAGPKTMLKTGVYMYAVVLSAIFFFNHKLSSCISWWLLLLLHSLHFPFLCNDLRRNTMCPCTLHTNTIRQPTLILPYLSNSLHVCVDGLLIPIYQPACLPAYLPAT